MTEPDGQVINPETFLGRWQRAVREANVPAISIHGARHTDAELALEAGGRLDIVSRQLGHSSIATTGNLYLHDAHEPAAEIPHLVGSLLDADREAPDGAFGGNFGGMTAQAEGVPISRHPS